MMTENIQSLFWRLRPNLTENTVRCLDWFNEWQKEQDIWGNLQLENPEQYVFLQNSHRGTMKQTYTTAYYTNSKHYDSETYYQNAKIQQTCFQRLLAIKSSQKSSITLLFMMARRHIIQTWMSSLASPMLSLATCLERLRTPGLSNTSNDGRR